MQRAKSEASVPVFKLLKDAVTCPALLVVAMCDFANLWGLNTLMTQGPIFMEQVLNFDITAVQDFLIRFNPSAELRCISASQPA